MNWKLSRIDWHRKGNCWTWKIKKFSYYQGNQVVISLWRIAVIFERKNWVRQ